MATDVAFLRQRLRDAPQKLLLAISSPSTLPAFQEEWMLLRQDVGRAVEGSLLDTEDMALVHAQASLIATIGSSFTIIETKWTQWTSALVDEIENIFSQLSIDDSDQSHLTRRQSVVSSINSRKSSSPYSNTAASRWLLRNLHDPYPVNDIKRGVSLEAGTSVGVVSDWFKRARKEIGWVALCKEHFQGSRALTVAAARHVFVKVDATSSLSAGIVSAFKAMEARARTLYSVDAEHDILPTRDGFPSSSPSPTSSSLSLPRRSPSVTSLASLSTCATPSLVFSDDEDAVEWATSSQLTSVDVGENTLGKRRSPRDADFGRPAKRPRSSPLSPDIPPSLESVVATNNTVSQVSSRERRFCDLASGPNTPVKSITAHDSSACSAPRMLPKRRISISSSQPVAKHPCRTLTAGPRKQAVSDPLPFTNTQSLIDEWFKDAFDPLQIAPPVEPVSLELCTDWHPFDTLRDSPLDMMDPTLSFSDLLHNFPVTSTFDGSTPDFTVLLGTSNVASSVDNTFQTNVATPSVDATLPQVPSTAFEPDSFELDDSNIVLDPDTMLLLETFLAESSTDDNYFASDHEALLSLG